MPQNILDSGQAELKEREGRAEPEQSPTQIRLAKFEPASPKTKPVPNPVSGDSVRYAIAGRGRYVVCNVGSVGAVGGVQYGAVGGGRFVGMAPTTGGIGRWLRGSHGAWARGHGRGQSTWACVCVCVAVVASEANRQVQTRTVHHLSPARAHHRIAVIVSPSSPRAARRFPRSVLTGPLPDRTVPASLTIVVIPRLEGRPPHDSHRRAF